MKKVVLLFLSAELVARASVVPSGFVDEIVGSPWNEAVGLTFAPDSRMFVWERAGRVWIVENGVKSSTPFLDISAEVGGWRDFGLLGFALHPNFYSNGFVYAFYVVDRHHLKYFGTSNYSPTSNEYYNATIGRVTRYTARASDGRRSVDPASRRILLGESASTGVPLLHESHGVGTLLFGTDGTLLASCGDGASYIDVDTGSQGVTYYQTALNDGIIRPKENVGAYRAQLVDALNGKILRLDPDTGDGLPSNPFYDSANPRAPRSRVWALGFRNPFRMTLRPNSGSHNAADGRPGVLYIGDVGWYTWEELSVCDAGGQNFGWPAFEGLTAPPDYPNAGVANRDAPNPLFGSGGCTQQYLYFRDLIKQDSLNAPSWPNPCNASQQIPATIRRFVHRRPAMDWRHEQDQARTGVYSNNQAAAINIGAPGSPVSGSMFRGNSSTGGAWYTNTAFPAQFQNTYFHADFGAHWIKSLVFTTNNQPAAVQNFASDAGGVVALAVEPSTGRLYYIAWTSELRRIRYVSSVNRAPVAVASANRIYGPSPLAVQFSSAGSGDPDGQALSYRWTFGDGTAANTNANPSHTFNAAAGVPTPFTVTFVVTDTGGASATNRLLISANNTPPQVTITSPVDGTRYSMSAAATYDCRATVTDAEHAAGQLRCAWQTILVHNDHEHVEPVDTNCATTTVISPVGCDGQTYYYRVLLTVTDAAGLATTNEVRLYPDCTGADSTAILISAGATWKYLDTGYPVGTTWRNLTFNDSGWASGPAQLGYGEGDEATVVSYGGNDTNKYITTYFRRRFAVTNAVGYSNVTLRLLCDDGAVVYLNSAELLRENMPAGTITSTTTAVIAIGDTNENLYLAYPIAPGLLLNGTNILAVEIHQANRTSTDVSFDLELLGHRPRTRPVLRSAVLSGGRFQLAFDASPATAYIIEASPDLRQWSPVSTNSSSTGAVEYIQPSAAPARRFFRVRTVP
jgi:glucose/arabinose dehydrogenase/PKD repeat protein